MLLQRNLSKRATCGPVMTDLTERWLRYTVKVDCNGLVLCSWDPWAAVCFRKVDTFIQWTDRFHFTLCAYVLCVYLIRYVSLYACNMSTTFAVYVIIFMHVAVCPLIVMHPSLQEFSAAVVNLMSSMVAVWSLVQSLVHGQTPTQLL